MITYVCFENLVIHYIRHPCFQKRLHLKPLLPIWPSCSLVTILNPPLFIIRFRCFFLWSILVTPLGDRFLNTCNLETFSTLQTSLKHKNLTNFQYIPVDFSSVSQFTIVFGSPELLRNFRQFFHGTCNQTFFHEDESMKKNYMDIYNTHSTQKSHKWWRRNR